MRRPASQGNKLHEEALCGFGTVPVRDPVCLESDRGEPPTTMATAATGRSIPIVMRTMLVVGKAMNDGVVGKGLVG